MQSDLYRNVQPETKPTDTSIAYAVECVDLNKRFDDTQVLTDLNLRVECCRIVALLGPSGCGKTTLLRLLAGFEWPDSGTIAINGRVVSSQRQQVPVEARRVGMVFQEYALFHHLNVAANIGFGLHGKRYSNPTAKRHRVEEMLNLVGLNELAARMPHELSGGQQQRVALARALAPDPDILLLDEPFSNLDATLRAQVRAEVRMILQRAGTTCLFVTHDREEALSFADEVAVLLQGRVVQISTPQTLYRYPATPTVAEFIGEANFLPADAKGITVNSVLGDLPILLTTLASQGSIHGAVDILIRPEMLSIDRTSTGTPATVIWAEYYGHAQRIGLQLGNGLQLIARIDVESPYKVGERVSVHCTSPVHVFKQ
jgi:iron(III) transport system ATP-binding protein